MTDLCRPTSAPTRGVRRVSQTTPSISVRRWGLGLAADSTRLVVHHCRVKILLKNAFVGGDLDIAAAHKRGGGWWMADAMCRRLRGGELSWRGSLASEHPKVSLISNPTVTCGCTPVKVGEAACFVRSSQRLPSRSPRVDLAAWHAIVPQERGL